MKRTAGAGRNIAFAGETAKKRPDIQLDIRPEVCDRPHGQRGEPIVWRKPPKHHRRRKGVTDPRRRRRRAPRDQRPSSLEQPGSAWRRCDTI
ncbi:hypothetical protein KL86PLE_100740 [uncultured Pleomorphomonas sp.]|uniref:Uncharacterized protein n=1 Tax=uncultured Pleomorphomonas sp. TaxID=442121 RepID=A0A212L5W3_9HYPH|nr:hypothetical protein KL86PLE_100740 [uncultured Pleomorphomonas sp.]